MNFSRKKVVNLIFYLYMSYWIDYVSNLQVLKTFASVFINLLTPQCLQMQIYVKPLLLQIYRHLLYNSKQKHYGYFFFVRAVNTFKYQWVKNVQIEKQIKLVINYWPWISFSSIDIQLDCCGEADQVNNKSAVLGYLNAYICHFYSKKRHLIKYNLIPVVFL